MDSGRVKPKGVALPFFLLLMTIFSYRAVKIR